jgi:hypothetical protein
MYSSAWYDDSQTIVLQTYRPPVTMDEIYAGLKVGEQLINSVDHPVYVMMDIGERFTLPKDFLRAARYVESKGKLNVLFSVIVGGGPVVKSLIGTLAAVAPRTLSQVKYAPTMADALKLIEKHRQANAVSA